MNRLKSIEQKLRSALRKTEPRGKQLVSNYVHFIRFAQQFIAMKNKIREARATYDEAQQMGKKGDVLGYHPVIGRASDLLFEAEKMSEQAIRTWTKQIADPSDLGSLAGLNAYGHDWLRGECVEVYWESQCYGGMMETD